MLARLITQGLQKARQYKYPKPYDNINFLTASLTALNPTQSSAPLLNGPGQLKYDVDFGNDQHGTFFAELLNGKISTTAFLNVQTLQVQFISDYQKLSVDEAMKLLIAKYPQFYPKNVSLSMVMLPNIKIPSYYFMDINRIRVEVDFDGNVN